MLIGDSVKRYLPPDIAAYVGASIFIILALDGFRGFVMMMRESSTQEENKLEDTTTVSLLDNPSGEEPTSNLNSEVVKAEDTAESSSAESLPDENSGTKNSIYFKNLFPGVPITIKEVILIALGTSFTNIASGLAAALAGYNAYVMSVTAVFTNFVLLLSGQVVGVNFGALVPEKYVKLMSSLVLLAIAIPYFCN